MYLPDLMCLTLDTEGTVFTQRPPFSIPQDPPLPFLAFVQDTDLKSNEFAVIWEQGLYSQASNFYRCKREKTLLSAACSSAGLLISGAAFMPFKNFYGNNINTHILIYPLLYPQYIFSLVSLVAYRLYKNIFTLSLKTFNSLFSQFCLLFPSFFSPSLLSLPLFSCLCYPLFSLFYCSGIKLTAGANTQ